MPRRFLSLLLFALACGNSSTTTPSNDGSSPFPDAGSSDAPLFADGTSPSGCVDSAKLVYVVSTQNELWSFDPGTLAFKKIGTLDCPTASTPESMAIDEKATAYVAMMDGALFSVDTSNAHCKATSYALEQQKRRIYDMAFVRGASSETLFVSTSCCYENGGVTVTNNGGGGLATLALPSYTLSLVGDWTNGLDGYPAALAGTGDGRLFAFVPNLAVTTDAGLKAQPTLALVDTTKTGSAPTPSPIALDGTKVGGGAAYAFSFWGGDFWFYSSSSTSAPSTVTRWRYATNKTYTQVVANTGMTIIGAGVSSCAPLSAPN